MTTVEIERYLESSPEELLRAAGQPIATSFADPVAPRVSAAGVRWTSTPDVVEDLERAVTVRAQDTGVVVTLRAEWSDRVPYFHWVFGPLIRRAARRSLEHMAEVLRARVAGEPEPEPRRPFWAPPDRMTRRQTRAIAALCAVIAVTAYGGSLFTHTLHFVAESYESSDATLAVALALARAGSFLGIVGSYLADRRGRRRMLLVSMVGVSIVTLFSAAAPNLLGFSALQVLARGFLQLAAVVAFIAAAEEAPEGARAYVLAFTSLAAGVGFALGALLLPLADLAPEAWRALFVVGGFGILLAPGIARRLSETTRYVALGKRVLEGRVSEIVDRVYGGRFAVVATTVFLMALVAAPTSQWMNRYLQDERGFSALGILLLRATTQVIPPVIAVLIGGRLAESSGRKPVASRATAVMALSTAGFFLTGGPLLWILLLLSTTAGALAGPSFAAFNTELFPTEVRGTAGAGLLALGNLGSVVGLLMVAYLGDLLGSGGRAVALTTIAPLIVALFLIRRLPEARGMLLDEISPPEV